MKKKEAIEKLREFCKLRAFCELYPDACQKDKCEIYMAIEALSEPSRQGQQNGLISHRDAIEAIDEITWYHQNANKDMVRGANSNEHQAWYKAEDVYKALESVPSAQPERWIPCSERLPEEDTEVLISYRYKEGEGDTDHVNIDITSYGTTCFGGREIHTLKEWRQPFDYFHANYEVIAWMPLPTPYREE